MAARKAFNPVKQQEILAHTVRVAMARLDIRTQGQLAVMLGMTRVTLNKRLTHGGWDFVELCRLFRTLEFTEDEIVRAMGAA